MPDADVLLATDRSRTAWRGSGPRPVRMHVRVPAGPAPYAAVVLSPGSGGGAADLAWVADGLTEAGLLTAVVEHHGNNSTDEPLPEGFAFWWERPADLGVALDHLSSTYRLGRAGVLGYSLGGYSAAAVLGARIDAGRLRRLYAGEAILPVPPDRPDVPEQVARLAEAYGPEQLQHRAVADHRDDRFEAAALLAPAISPILEESSLRAIVRPVLVRWADADQVETEGRRYGLIPGSDAMAVGGGHFDFCGNQESGARLRADLLPQIVRFFGRLTAE